MIHYRVFWGQGLQVKGLGLYTKWTPHPVLETIRDNGNSILGLFTVLKYHYDRVGGPPKVRI